MADIWPNGGWLWRFEASEGMDGFDYDPLMFLSSRLTSNSV